MQSVMATKTLAKEPFNAVVLNLSCFVVPFQRPSTPVAPTHQ